MVISDIVKAEKEKQEKIEAEERAEEEKIEDEARAERREKYLESLSEKERKDVLERERERERKREDILERERERERNYREDAQEGEKREWERVPEPDKPRKKPLKKPKKRKVPQEPKAGFEKQTLLDIINKEPEEVEEVFPWEKEGISQD